MVARSAVRTVSPVSGSSVPSTRTMPCSVTDACRRRALGALPRRRCLVRVRRPDANTPRPVRGRRPSGCARLRRVAAPRPRTRWIGIPRGDQTPRGAHRDVTRLDRDAGGRHLVQGSRRSHLVARHAPRHLESGREPPGGREVPVPLEQTPTLDLTEPPERFQLELVDDAADLGEVLLDPCVGKLGERLAAQRPNRRPKLAHAVVPVGCGADVSNMCSTLASSERTSVSLVTSGSWCSDTREVAQAIAGSRQPRPSYGTTR